MQINRHKAFRVIAVISLLNVLVASGFSIAGLIRPDLILPPPATSGGAGAVFAMYAAARALPLAGAVILAAVMRWTSALLVLGSLAGVIQLADAIVGIIQGDLGKTIGPLVFACLQAYAVLPPKA